MIHWKKSLKPNCICNSNIWSHHVLHSIGCLSIHPSITLSCSHGQFLFWYVCICFTAQHTHITLQSMICDFLKCASFFFRKKKKTSCQMYFKVNEPDECVSVPSVVICLVMIGCVCWQKQRHCMLLCRWKHAPNRNVSQRFHSRWAEVQHTLFLCNLITHLRGLHQVTWHNIVHCFHSVSVMAENGTWLVFASPC